MKQADDGDINLITMFTTLYTFQKQVCIGKVSCSTYDKIGKYFFNITTVLQNPALQCSVVHQCKPFHMSITALKLEVLFYLRKAKMGKSLLWQTKPKRHWENKTVG